MSAPIFQIRPALPSDAAACAEINLSSWRSAYKGIIADSTLLKMNYTDLLKKWKWRLEQKDQEIFCIVGTLDDAVIAYLLCGKNRNKKFPQQQEIMAMYITEVYRRSGYGKKLFAHVISEMRIRAIPSFLVFALKENRSARNFYSSFSPAFEGETTLVIDGKTYEEVCYGWDDLQNIETE